MERNMEHTNVEPIRSPDMLTTYPAGIRNSKHHTSVLNYLMSRINAEKTRLTAMRERFGFVDVAVSTWRTLSKEDTERQRKNEQEGASIPVASNLPLIHTHIEDMVAFYTQVLMPHGEGYQQMPKTHAQASELNPLIDLFNKDARISKQRKHLAAALRALSKYNIGGFHVDWIDTQTRDSNAGGHNKVEGLDMYNTIWDPAVSDPALIPTDAEWAARVYLRTPKWFIDGQSANRLDGIGRVLPKPTDTEGDDDRRKGSVYGAPPALSRAESRNSGRSRAGTTMDWDGYGASLAADASVYDGYEVIDMYCWLIPSQLKLAGYANAAERNQLRLFRVMISGNGTEIIHLRDMTPVVEGQIADSPIIPIFAGYLNQDDLGPAQRSPAEQMIPFQNFASFLMNSHVQGTRSNIVGWTFYDPTFIGMNDLNREEGAAYVPVRGLNGRDIRSVIQRFNTTYDTSNTIQSLQFTRQLMNDYYPAQAAPAQIAGIDRAVKNQVSAVMHGANRRAQLIVQILDADIIRPMIEQMYKNHVFKGQFTTKATDDEVLAAVGSGIKQLNREAAEMSFREILMISMQNPDALTPDSPVHKMLSFWGVLQGLDVNLADIIQPEQGTQDEPVQPQAEDDLGASEGVASTLAASPADRLV